MGHLQGFGNPKTLNAGGRRSSETRFGEPAARAEIHMPRPLSQVTPLFPLVPETPPNTVITENTSIIRKLIDFN